MNKILSVHTPEMAHASYALTTATPRADLLSVEDPLLVMKEFGVTFSSNPVLSGLSFTVPQKGAVLLVGPKATERTALLRILAGYGADSASFKTMGSALYRGEVLGVGGRPALAAQNARLMMSPVLDNVLLHLPGCNQLTQTAKKERAQQLLVDAGLEEICDQLNEAAFSLPLVLQRHLTILREIVADPPLLCIDEPTAGLTDVEAARLIAYLRAESQKRALLIAMHNQVHARLLGGHAVFIAYGRMLEQQPIPQIFDMPVTAAAQEFSDTGKCSVASYETSLKNQVAVHHSLSDSAEIQAPDALNIDVPAASQPEMEAGKFMWLKRGMLAGTPAPGKLADVDTDLRVLREHGITVIMTLTDNGMDETSLQVHGLKSVHEPIPALGAPSMVQGIRICKTLETLLQQGEVIAIQGECGLGRTGTVLAAHLLWKGIKLPDALEYLRRVEPRWVQTQAQLDFLGEFAQRV